MESLLLHGPQHYIVSNSYNLVRELHASCADVGSTRESHGAASSSSVSSPQLPHSAISSQVPACPTRNVTGDVMSTSLAEAATQLSLLHFVQRCNLLIAPLPRRQPSPTLLLDAATQTIPHIAVSQDVSTQLSFREFLAPPSTHDVLCPTCSRPVPSLLFDAAVQTPSHSVATHDASTQLPLTEFFIGCILSNDLLDRQALPSDCWQRLTASTS